MKREKFFLGFAVGLVAFVVLLSSSAAQPPVKPIKDFQSIAGTWKSVDGERTLFLNADGTYTNQGGQGRGGTLEINDGKFFTSRGSVITFREVEGKQVLFSISSRGSRREWKKVNDGRTALLLAEGRDTRILPSF
ncbi:MAG: hypothetical protein O6948_12620 [Deltaproteobacteria bacterium]|nr:hypothetical protein [Deltaproteobacteria bacterium]